MLCPLNRPRSGCRLGPAGVWPSSSCIDLEVARSPEQQRLGLMQRPALPPLRGMWFPFATPQPQRFWMFNTLAPLDMIFVRDGAGARSGACRSHLLLPCPVAPTPPMRMAMDGLISLKR